MRILKIILIFCHSYIYSQTYNIYLDADMSINKKAGESIRNGIMSAIDYYKEHNPKTKIELTLKTLNHRGNTRRSLANFKKALADEKMIAVFGGLHSPPLITNNNFINESKILTLVPWAAGAPITRSKVSENWIYRLSIDDSQAGGFITREALKDGCKSPYLLLEKTPWGKSNEKNMSSALAKNGIKGFNIRVFDWGITKSSSSEIALDIAESEQDCIFFVGNTSDAKRIFNALGRKKVKQKIYSHWGITGNNNVEMAEIISSNKLDVSVIQTSFSFVDKNLNNIQKKIAKFILKKNKYQNLSELSPVSGWAHSFDLTLILLHAIDKIKIKKADSISIIRHRIKESIEDVSNIKGLIKVYNKPFNNNEKYNSHEALSSSDYTMRKYQEDGTLR